MRVSKILFKERHFATLGNIYMAVADQLKAITIFEFQHWLKSGKPVSKAVWLPKEINYEGHNVKLLF